MMKLIKSRPIHLSVCFQMKALGELNRFLGLEVECTKDGIFLCQHKYTKDLLENFEMSDCKPIATPGRSTYKAMFN